MNWYIPITIIPGLGMLILSTTSQTMALSAEINKLLSSKCSTFQHEISDRKIKQLGLLTKATALLYTATCLYVLSGILGALQETENLWSAPTISLFLGTILVFIALMLLITYAFRAVKIRRQQFEHNHLLEN